jgi:hypothetical protein
MEDQRMRHSRPRPIRSTVVRALAVLAATAVLLAACGGDGGGDGASDFTLHALIVNASDAEVTVTYTGTDPAEEATQASCTADIHNFPVADPFTFTIGDEVVIDSDADLPDGIPNDGESDLIVRIDIAQDGTASFDKVRPGSDIGKPSKAAYCPSLPG